MNLIFANLLARVKKYFEFGISSGFGTPQAWPENGLDKRASPPEKDIFEEEKYMEHPPEKDIFENKYLEDPAQKEIFEINTWKILKIDTWKIQQRGWIPTPIVWTGDKLKQFDHLNIMK